MNNPVPILPQIDALPQYVSPKAAPSPRAIKLSSNENPYPVLPQIAQAAAAEMLQVNRYPDLFAGDLRQCLAQIGGVPFEGTAVGTGSVALLADILKAVAGPSQRVIIPWRSFEAYPIIVGTLGAQCVQVALDQDHRHDLAAMAHAARYTVGEAGRQVCDNMATAPADWDPAAEIEIPAAAVLLCSPNNPTGPILTQQEVETFLKQIPAQTLVVLDEAYCHFVTDPQAVDGTKLLAQYPNLVVLRTFSKAYQMAGLRLGYMLTHNVELAAAVRAASTPFGASRPALAAGLAALDAEEEIKDQVAKIVAERERVLAAVRALGWRVPQAQGNFFWLPYPEKVGEILEATRADEITVRPWSAGVRVSIGLPEENDRFLAALATVSPPQ